MLCYLTIENDLWDDDSEIDECNCLPACASISYDAELSQSKYKLHEFVEALDDTDDALDGYAKTKNVFCVAIC